jgi:hypothetical protein
MGSVGSPQKSARLAAAKSSPTAAHILVPLPTRIDYLPARGRIAHYLKHERAKERQAASKVFRGLYQEGFVEDADLHGNGCPYSILRGKPSDLPVMHATTFDLVINLTPRRRLASAFPRRCLPGQPT